MTLKRFDNVVVPQHFGCLLYVRKTHEYLPYDRLTTDVLIHTAKQSLFKLAGPLANQISPKQMDAFCKIGRRMKFLDRNGRFYQLEQLSRECVDMGCMRMALTGGEPLNRPDIFELIDTAMDKGIDVCLTTNGIRIDKDISRELAKRPLAWINISLDGACAKTNDAIRGKGTFDKVTGNIIRHLRWRVPFGLSFTINKLNIGELLALPGLAKKLGAQALLLRGVYPLGRAKGAKEIHLSLSQYEKALATLASSSYPIRVVPTSCEAEEHENMAVVFENYGCAAGNTTASVYHNGDVSPCSLIGDGVELENLHSYSLTRIWNNGRGFKKIRELSPPGICRECDAYTSCSGGCRARAWAAYRDIQAPDPWCKAIKKSAEEKAYLKRFYNHSLSLFS
jgi:radical SAM protein with 4Fe4S-binding SPASM domain